MLKVLVVEDEPYVRRGIVLSVDWTALDCFVVGEAANGEEGYDAALKFQPNIIITDIRMPKMDGIEMLKRLREAGFQLTGQEPLKLTILSKSYGYTGDELARILEEKNIFCEFSDPDHLVLMLPVAYDEGLPQMLTRALMEIPRRVPVSIPAPVLHRAEAVFSPHEALLCPSQVIPTKDAVGKIMADPTVSCPPAIPVVCSGERIDTWAVEAMKYYGITQVRVTVE